MHRPPTGVWWIFSGCLYYAAFVVEGWVSKVCIFMSIGYLGIGFLSRVLDWVDRVVEAENKKK